MSWIPYAATGKGRVSRPVERMCVRELKLGPVGECAPPDHPSAASERHHPMLAFPAAVPVHSGRCVA